MQASAIPGPGENGAGFLIDPGGLSDPSPYQNTNQSKTCANFTKTGDIGREVRYRRHIRNLVEMSREAPWTSSEPGEKSYQECSVAYEETC